MKTIRQYIAQYDNGRDYGEFAYHSAHRNGSAANKEDAKTEMILRYGMRARNYKITSTYRSNDKI